MLTPDNIDKLTNNKIVNEYEKLNQKITNEIIALIISSDLNKNSIKSNSKRVYKNSLKTTQNITSKRKKYTNDLFNELATTQIEGYDVTFDSNIKQIVMATIKNTNNDLNNLTRTIAYQGKKSYVDAMNDIYKTVITGKEDHQTAIDRVIEYLSKKGITFKTSNGRNERIETVVKRGLHGSIKSVADTIAKKIGNDIDYNCVRIGHSSKCRPSHQPIDDVTMSKEIFKEYEYLTEEYNCNHIVNYLWLAEFDNNENKVVYGSEHTTMQEVERKYKEQQKINYLKRQIKSKKNVVASGNTSDKAKKELRNAQLKLRIYNNSWINKLTERERYSLNKYISSDSYKINELLYNNKKLTAEQKDFINDLDNSLMKAPKYYGYVNRSVEITSSEQLNNILSIFDNNDGIGSWKSYISSSKEFYDENMKLQFKIKSINGRNLSTLNDEGGGEILFERTSKFKYIDYYKKDGKIFIELEEVEQYDKKR